MVQNSIKIMNLKKAKTDYPILKVLAERWSPYGFADKPVAEASAAIRHFLDSHEDAPTGAGFKVGKKGVLEQAPTLRTALCSPFTIRLNRLSFAVAASLPSRRWYSTR